MVVRGPWGCCSRSASVWSHWFELAIAVEWEAIVKAAERHGLTVASRRPDLDALLTGKFRFVSLRGDLWEAWAGGLGGDDAYLPVAELTPEERARHAEALDGCRCPICPMLRLDPEVAEKLLPQLDDADTASSAGGIWREHTGCLLRR